MIKFFKGAQINQLNVDRHKQLFAYKIIIVFLIQLSISA